ncbi:hypothetical protein M407DRAFT_18208 [Tulasnella calospora MUT 4182]|uniref:Transmembrane protein n=1 Tax=Tulasnella calospora MUT 4182 TaxID=1051891 RepID=A0A0C3QTY2_9AGAM|nr:hypothetical protein M407DRAFT_18208 [Tulasnella calospora MUT 4182]
MLGLALLLSAFWSTSPVQAQTTSAVCRNSFSYLSNTKGQSPCLVSAYLQAPCSSEGANFAVPALENQSLYPGQFGGFFKVFRAGFDGGVYPGPSPTEVNYCTCSSVVYSLSSACAACQGELWPAWTAWRRYCTQNLVTVGQYPLDIPEGTAVPAWAYQNVALTDTWNISLTSTSATLGPESTYYGTPTASINYQLNMTGEAASQTAVAGTQTGSSSTGTGSATAGAVTGGVIGGIGLLALIGALAWLLIRQRRRKRGGLDSPIGTYGSAGLPMGETDRHTIPPAYPQTPSPFTGSTSTMPKLYDPSDPSTFPRTPASFVYQSATPTDMTPPVPPPIPLPLSPTHTGGRYSGAPEL